MKITNFRVDRISNVSNPRLDYPNLHPDEISDRIDRLPNNSMKECAYQEYQQLCQIVHATLFKPLSDNRIAELIAEISSNRFFGIEK